MYFLSNLIVAYLVASIFVYGAFANLNGEFLQMEKFQLLAVISGSAFFSTLAREIVKDIEDVEGDRKRYSVTLPIRHGIPAARQVANTFLSIAIILSAIPILIPGKYFNTVTYAVLIIISNLIFISSLNRHPATAQKMMIAGMTVAILAFFVGEFTTNLF